MKINYSIKIDILFNDKILCTSTLFDYDDILGRLSLFVKPSLHIPANRQITILLYSIGGNRSYCRGETLESLPGKLDIQLIGEITTEADRRRALKIDAAPELKAKVTVEGIPYDASIKDISITGIFLKYEGELSVGRKCRVSITDLKTSDIVVKIIRRHPDNSGYGCEFQEIKQKDVDAISSYIYQRQMQELTEIRSKQKF